MCGQPHAKGISLFYSSERWWGEKEGHILSGERLQEVYSVLLQGK